MVLRVAPLTPDRELCARRRLGATAAAGAADVVRKTGALQLRAAGGRRVEAERRWVHARRWLAPESGRDVPVGLDASSSRYLALSPISTRGAHARTVGARGDGRAG